MPDARTHRVLIAEHLDAECIEWLAERATVVQARQGTREFDRALAEADAIIVRTYVCVGPELLTHAPRLRVVGRAGVGLDNIDLPACAAHGLRVVNTPGANTQSVVELVLASIFDVHRPRPALTGALSAPEWEAERARNIAARQVSELTLGVLGLGRIGSALARAGEALGMPILYHDLREIPEPQRFGARPVARKALLEGADVLSIHVDGRPQNRGLIGTPELDRLRPEALLINTSRGFVIDTPALAAWLRANPRARAVIDVHEPEPFAADYPLLGLENARLTAHLGSGTRTAKRNMSWVVREVWDALVASRAAGTG